MLLTKAAQRLRLIAPITRGDHTVEEVATLIAEGKSWAEVARMWGLRSRMGAQDLYLDVHHAWEQVGAPGGPAEEPSGEGAYLGPAWNAWREARRAAVDAWLDGLAGKATLKSERTADGHPQVWLLYRPEPFEFGSDDDRSIHLWVRRCEVFTSRIEAIAHLDNLLGHQVPWRPYNELFPELWIGIDHRGYRWLMEPAPVNPPGGKL